MLVDLNECTATKKGKNTGGLVKYPLKGEETKSRRKGNRKDRTHKIRQREKKKERQDQQKKKKRKRKKEKREEGVIVKESARTMKSHRSGDNGRQKVMQRQEGRKRPKFQGRVMTRFDAANCTSMCDQSKYIQTMCVL